MSKLSMTNDSVLGDAGYGRNPDFPEAIEKRQIPYLLAVPACFSVRKIEDVKHAQETSPSDTA
jgi:hypothetical protein